MYGTTYLPTIKLSMQNTTYRKTNYRTAIQHATSDECKKDFGAEFTKHLEEAQKECDAYLAAIEKSKLALTTSNERPTFAHITLCPTGISPISFSAGESTLLR